MNDDDIIPYDLIQGQSQGYETLKVQNSYISKSAFSAI